jgi:hypothetical protein
MAHKLALESVIEQIGESSSVPSRMLLEEAQAALEKVSE